MAQANSPDLADLVGSPTAARPPLYQIIVEDVIQKIHSGEYAAGDRLASVGDLCAHYDVSAATAHRSMATLAGMGVVRTVPRKGVYVVGVPTPPAVKESSRVQRVLLVESLAQRHQRRSLPGGVRSFSEGAVDAIVRTCRQHHIPLEFQFIPVDVSASPRIFFTPRTGDAIISIGAQVSAALLSHMATPNVASVLVDAAAPNGHCVLTDNHAGMHQVVEHLRGHGHRNIVVAVCYATRVANTTNENERRDALLHHAAVAGMNALAIDSGDWEELFASLRVTAGRNGRGATAVVFTRDDPAVQFIDMARQRGYDVPGDISVVGFDDWSSHPQALSELTTVHVDVEQLGRAAMEMVLNPPDCRSRLYTWRRVRPTLVSRSTVARVECSTATACESDSHASHR